MAARKETPTNMTPKPSDESLIDLNHNIDPRLQTHHIGTTSNAPSVQAAAQAHPAVHGTGNVQPIPTAIQAHQPVYYNTEMHRANYESLRAMYGRSLFPDPTPSDPCTSYFYGRGGTNDQGDSRNEVGLRDQGGLYGPGNPDDLGVRNGPGSVHGPGSVLGPVQDLGGLQDQGGLNDLGDPHGSGQRDRPSGVQAQVYGPHNFRPPPPHLTAGNRVRKRNRRTPFPAGSKCPHCGLNDFEDRIHWQ